ncbi:MAG: hypothetical protein LBB90_03225 [Tannerella sp.]|jgi:hypothetical protein|nr:hypothetical protein [Tannerella sp.]
MKKVLILVVLFISVIVQGSAQLPIPSLPPDYKPSHIPVKGGKDGKNYAVIISTALSRKDLIKKTVDFLVQWKMVNPDEVKLDEISDEQAEYTVPVLLRQSFYGIPFKMGLSLPYPPVVIFGDLRFEFHDNGKVMIVIENLREMIFCVINKGVTNFVFNEESSKDPNVSEYYGLLANVTVENSLLAKILVGATGGVGGLIEYNKKMGEYFNNIDSRYELFDKIESAGKGTWLTDEKFVAYGDNTIAYVKGEGLKTMLDVHKSYLDEGRLLAIPRMRWEDNIRFVMAILFKSINIVLEGSIEGVAEDGEQTYYNIDGTVLPLDPKWKDKTPPTDPKEREAYVKRNKKKEY